MSDYNKVLSIQISAIREVYQYIDSKITAFVDAETRLNDALEQKNICEKKFSGKHFILYVIATCFLLIIPLSLISMIVSLPLYTATPFVAILAVYFVKKDYQTKKMPALLKATSDTETTAFNERENLVNLIYQSHYNVKADIETIVSNTEDDEFLEKIFCEGIPVECKNIVALDYMYCAVKKGYANTFAEAITHFQELKESLMDNKTEEGCKLYKEIIDGELFSEYRTGIIKRCEHLKKQQLQQAS